MLLINTSSSQIINDHFMLSIPLCDQQVDIISSTRVETITYRFISHHRTEHWYEQITSRCTSTIVAIPLILLLSYKLIAQNLLTKWPSWWKGANIWTVWMITEVTSLGPQSYDSLLCLFFTISKRFTTEAHSYM